MLVFRCSIASDVYWSKIKCMGGYLNKLMFLTRVFSFLCRCLRKDVQRRNERSIRRLAYIIATCHNHKAAFEGFCYALSEKQILDIGHALFQEKANLSRLALLNMRCVKHTVLQIL